MRSARSAASAMPSYVIAVPGIACIGAARKRSSVRAFQTMPDPCIAGEYIEAEIRGPEVTRYVSQVAQMPRVREWVNALVRETAKRLAA